MSKPRRKLTPERLARVKEAVSAAQKRRWAKWRAKKGKDAFHAAVVNRLSKEGVVMPDEIERAIATINRLIAEHEGEIKTLKNAHNVLLSELPNP